MQFLLFNFEWMLLLWLLFNIHLWTRKFLWRYFLLSTDHKKMPGLQVQIQMYWSKSWHIRSICTYRTCKGTGILVLNNYFHIDKSKTSGAGTFILTSSYSYLFLPHDLISWEKAELTWGRVAGDGELQGEAGWASRTDKVAAPYTQIPFLLIIFDFST